MGQVSSTEVALLPVSCAGCKQSGPQGQASQAGEGGVSSPYEF